MAARQQISFQPALAHVFAQDLHHSPIGSTSVHRRVASFPSTRRSVTSNTASSRLDAVSSGPMSRKFRLSAG